MKEMAAETAITDLPLIADRDYLERAGHDEVRPLLSDVADDYPGGIIIPVDKPYRWTSADVIRKIRNIATRHFRKKNLKVGHAGTLDPLATGVLLVCIGKATRLAEQLQSHDKEYVAGITFGATTPSYDLEKEIDRLFPHSHVTKSSIEAVLPGFIGEQEQIAPLFSAKSVDGIRAYEIARKLYRRGESIDPTAAGLIRTSVITISDIELLSFHPQGRREEAACGQAEADGTHGQSGTDGRSLRINVTDNSSLNLPEAVIRLECSKGTYVRAFARDLGEALDSGAHLSFLRRSRSGEFRMEKALKIDEAVSLFRN